LRANQFNDPKTDIQILVTTYRTCAVGVNLHRACSDIVMVEPAINANTVLQAIGRVHRLGQTKEQTIRILFVDQSFNRRVEYNQAKKMIGQRVRRLRVLSTFAMLGELKDTKDLTLSGTEDRKQGWYRNKPGHLYSPVVRRMRFILLRSAQTATEM